MKRILRAAWFVFWNNWGWFVIVMPLVLGGLTFVMLGMFSPVIFTWPYSLEEIGAAAAAITVMFVCIMGVMTLMFGVDVEGYVDEVKWIADMQDTDNPPPPPPSGSRIALHRRSRTQNTRKGG